MKKAMIFIVFTLCASLLLAGCGAQAEVNDTPTTTTTAGFISEEEAISVAEQHFQIENGSHDDKTGYLIAYRVVIQPTEGNPLYRVALQWLVEVEGEDSHWSTLDTVTIDAKTGAVLTETINP